MQTLSGKIMRDGTAVVDSVRGNFEVEVKRDGTELWSGYFALPTASSLNNGEHYDLVLDDGRTKKIEINRVNVYPTQTTASFSTPG